MLTDPVLYEHKMLEQFFLFLELSRANPEDKEK